MGRSRISSPKMLKDEDGDDKMHTVVEGKIEISFYKRALSEVNDTDSIYVSTCYNNNEEALRIGLKWHDHYRPTILRAKRIIKKAYSVSTANEMAILDRVVAQINPNRIDNILMGDVDSDKKDRDSS